MNGKLVVLVILVLIFFAADAFADMRSDYEEIENYRNSKGDPIEYGGGTEDELIKKWIN